MLINPCKAYADLGINHCEWIFEMQLEEGLLGSISQWYGSTVDPNELNGLWNLEKSSFHCIEALCSLIWSFSK